MGAESQEPGNPGGEPLGANNRSKEPAEAAQGAWPFQMPDTDAPLAPQPPSRADTTEVLPPRLRPRPPRQISPWATLGLVALATVVVVSAGLYAYSRVGASGGTTVPPGCDQQDSPCTVARAYLADYTAGKYEAMYALVSNASKTRFGDKQILGNTYSDAHDYIVNRTSGLLTEAQVYDVQATSGGQRLTGKATAVVPAHIVMQTQRIGAITENIQIPLVLEAGHWRVNWSPGLVFAQLDDPADPMYQRHVHLFRYDASRGRILARDGTPLALDETVQIVGVVPGQIKNEQQMLQVLQADLGYSSDHIKQQYQGHSPDEFVAIRTLTQDQYNKISGDLAPLLNAGVQVQSGTGRVYPYGADTAPVTGYVSVVQPQDLVNDTDHYYENNANQMVGHAGIEEWAEKQLRPVKGGELDIVPLNQDGSFGPPAYTLARRSPANGADVHTAIDLTLQQRAMADLRALPFTSGTVSIDPTTGEVLALASNPMSDPNALSLGYTGSTITLQFLNHAVQDAVPIGSVMKVTTLAAALQSGIANTQTFTCAGTYLVPGESQARTDWLPQGHGTISTATALAESCDVVFWQIAVQLNAKDPNLLPQMAKGFGYGAKTDLVGLPSDEENPGLVPDPQWMKDNHIGGWSPTDAANLAIGQGFFLATPLQIAAAAAAVANHGQRMQPRLVTSIVGVDGQTIASYPAKVLGTLPVSADHLAILQADMLGPTTDPSGTAYSLFGHFPVLVAGKTGTAESSQPHPHALFIAYAPASPLGGPAVTPKISVGTLVEYGQHGNVDAGPIVKDLIGFYLNV